MRTICYCFVNRSKLGRVKELIWQITGVLAGVIHSRHPGRLLRACTLLKTIVDHGCQWVLHIGLKHISVQGIIQRNFLSRIHCALGENGQLAGLVRDHGFELVIVHFTHVIFETTVQDGAGHFGSVTELGWQATNVAANAQDVLGEQPENDSKIVMEFWLKILDQVLPGQLGSRLVSHTATSGAICWPSSQAIPRFGNFYFEGSLVLEISILRDPSFQEFRNRH